MVIEDPALRGWGPGYPNCQYGRVKTLARPDGLRLSVREEILPLVAWLLDETERRGYDVLVGQTWGYACRSIRGSSRPSNHSWGLAVDINSPTNPMQSGSPGWKALHDSKRTDMPAWLPELWKAHMFRWGGDYRNRQDPMHFEFMGSPDDARRIISELSSDAAPIKLTETLREGSRGAAVLGVQRLLRRCATKHANPALDPGTPDGIFGKMTAQAVVAFKNMVISIETAAGTPVTFKSADPSVGPVTLGALQFWAAN